MKEIEKVSLAKTAFNLEIDAYQRLNIYLERLSDYYANEEGADEIMSDIEDRIADLIIEKNGQDNLVSLEVINSIIQILGDVDTLCDRETIKNIPMQSKKIYRNLDNKVVGGVFGGLAVYFNIDSVPIRIIYSICSLAIFYGGFSYHTPFPFFTPIILYFILWLCIPAAKTIAQKCAMMGESADVLNVRNSQNKYVSRSGNTSLPIFSRNNPFVRVISVCLGLIFILIFLGLLIGSLTFITHVNFTLGGLTIFSFLDYIDTAWVNSNWLIGFLLLTALLPFLWLGYVSILLLFNLKGNKLGLIIFVLWLISLSISIFLSINAGKSNWQQGRHQSSYELVSHSKDTLLVNLEPINNWNVIKEIRANSSYYSLICVDDRMEDNLKIAIYPPIRIINTNDSIIKVKYIKKGASPISYAEALYDAQKKESLIEIIDSSINISPAIYSKKNKLKMDIDEIRIYLPKGKEVKIEGPTEFGFDKHIRSNNELIRWML